MSEPALVQQVQEQLLPQLEGIAGAAAERGEASTAVFFMTLAERLRQAVDEEGLLEVTLTLSTCAFAGLDYGQASAGEIDTVLGSAIDIATTLGAPGDVPH